MTKLMINTSSPYRVHMDRGLMDHMGALVCEDVLEGKSGDRHICIVADAFTHEKFSHRVESSMREKGFTVHKTVFPRGEDAKTMGNLERLLEYLADEGFSRSDMLLALGGGTIGDLAGFAAASYLRGVKYIQVPTTLLAAVDSSVGGKTAVNLSRGKNLAGALWQPSLVVLDFDTLDTLPRDQILCGMAEVIKSAVIGDPVLFEYIYNDDEKDRDVFMRECVEAAVKVKARLVEGDERDNGRRQLLNLGHTMAHAMELCSDYSLSHGMAVAVGMRACARAALKMGWSRTDCFTPLDRLLKKTSYDLSCPYSPAQLAQAALSDKKRRGHTITLSVPIEIGRCDLVKLPVDRLEEFFAIGMDEGK